MKKWVKITVIAATAIAALAIGFAIAVPPITKNYIQKHDRELLGREIRMDRLRFNIFTGRLRIEGLQVSDAEDSTTFFRLDSFDMRMRMWPLAAHRIDIRRLAFTGAEMKVYQRGSDFSFDDLLDRFFGLAAPEDVSVRPWDIRIDNISFRRSTIFYKDLLLNATWGLNDINLNIPGIRFTGEKTDVETVLNFAQGGTLATNVGYNIATSEFEIGLRLRDFTLAGARPYFRQTLDIDAVFGLLSADLRLRGNAEHLLSTRTDGTAWITGFALYDRHKKPVVKIDSLSTVLAEADPGKMRFRFDKVYIAGFSTLAEQTSEGNNLMALIKTPEATSATQAELAEAPFYTSGLYPSLYIADLEVASGQITLRDLTLHKPFEYKLSAIRMRSRNFDPSRRNSLTVEARMQKTGSAKLHWEGSLKDLSDHNVTLLLSNVDLCDFTPYSEYYTAYPLTHGNLTLRSQNIIRNGQIDGMNHIDIFEPMVDKKRKGMKPEMDIPLKLGLYVLRDKKGHVRMDLPVKGSIDSPEFSYKKVVSKGVGNVLGKVITAPFSFLTGSRDKLDYINVDPLQDGFTSAQYAMFDRIAKSLQDKPGMHVTLTQHVNIQRALPLYAVNMLRMEYAQHLRAKDSLQHRPFSMLEYERAQKMDIRTPAIMAFADSLLKVRGVRTKKLSPNAKALALYKDEAAGELARMIGDRNDALAAYMKSAHGVTVPLLRVEALDKKAQKNYKGRDRYTITLEADGETIEIETEEEGTIADQIE